MKSDDSNIKELIKLLGFLPQDGEKDIYYKTYSSHNNYIIKLDFDERNIDYGSDIEVGDLTTSNFDSSENFVVLECINRLLEKGYLPSHLSLEYKWLMGRKEKGKLDILVKDNDDKCYLMIECKTWEKEYIKEKNKMKSDGGQLLSYFQQDKSAQYLCLYASRLYKGNVEYINDIIKVDPHWSELHNQKEIFNHWNKNFKDNGIFDSWVNPYNVETRGLIRERLRELTEEDSGRIFNQFAEILRHNIVSDKPNAFNKILNLFICKIIDEDKTDEEEMDFQWLENDTHESLQMRLNDLYKEGMKRFLDIEVTDYSDDQLEKKLFNLSDPKVRVQIKEMFKDIRLQKNPEFAFKEVYDDKSFDDNAIVVRDIVKLLEEYQFRYSHKQQFLGNFFELLLNTSIKQESGQFFTPIPIAKFIISCMPINEIINNNIENNTAHVLPYAIDYATGSGHFLTEWMDSVQGIINSFEVDKLRPSVKNLIKSWQSNPFQWAGEYVYGIEADYRLVKTAKVSSFLNGDGEAKIIRANGLDSFKHSTDFKSKLKEFNVEDNKQNKQFDIVIANPPYSVSAFKNTLKHGEDSFDLYNRLTDDSSEIECLFIERTAQLLKEGGVAGIILPSSILSNAGIYTDTREMLLKLFYIKSIVELGPNTFMATGTNTVILFLERRSNNDWKKINLDIENFFKNPKDFTLNGIEQAFTKYVEEVYPDIDLDDYVTFINKKPNEKIKVSDIYISYLKWFDDLTDIKHIKDKNSFNKKSKEEQNKKLNTMFFEKIFELEKDKMLYFFLTYMQKTTIVKVGEKQAEKDFIGYEFIKRRGHEGIRLYRDSNKKLTTKLYDNENALNQNKVNYHIYNSFLNKNTEIPTELSENIFENHLINLIDFNQIEFLKKISLNVKKKVIKKYKYDLRPIGDISEDIVNGKTPLKRENKYWLEATFPWITIPDILTDNIYIESSSQYVSEKAIEEGKIRVVDPGSVLISCTATIGKVAINTIPITTNQQINAIVCNEDKVIPEYLGYFLQTYGYQLADLTSNVGVKHVNLSMLRNFKIPLPSLDIQKEVVRDINVLHKNRLNLINEIERLSELKNVKLLEVYNLDYNLERLSKIAIINPSKTEIKGVSDNEIVSFIEMASVSENGYIEYSEDKRLGDLRKGSYTYFQEDDIIIAKITPSMENGKCALARNLTNSLGMGSSEFHVIRSLDPDIISNQYIFIMLNRDEVRAEAKMQMTGSSGHRRVPDRYYKEFSIPIPSIDIQKDIVDEVERLENKIRKNQLELITFDSDKKQIFKKYLES